MHTKSVFFAAAILFAACAPEGPGTIGLRARLPDEFARVQTSSGYRSQAIEAGRALDVIRVTVADGETIVARGEFAADAREGELINLPAGTYRVSVEALTSGRAVLRDTKSGVVVEAGAHTDAGEFLLAPVQPRMPVLTVAAPPVTSQTRLTLTGAKEMFTSVVVNGQAAAAPLDAKTFTHELTLAEGRNAITLVERNPEGAESEGLELTVELDTVAPSATSLSLVSIEGAVALLALQAAGGEEMQLSSRSDFAGAPWIAFEAAPKFAFDTKALAVTVYARLRDKAGNLSTTVSFTFNPDVTPPAAPSVSVQGAPAAVSSPAVTLVLSATGTPAEMQVSEDAAFSGAVWETFAATRVFSLSVGDGIKTIYARFRDAAGNVSTDVSVSILLDQTPPVAPGTPVFSANPVSGPVVISWSAASDATAGLKQYVVQEWVTMVDMVVVAVTTATAITHTPSGDHIYRVQAVDNAGNASLSGLSPRIVFDTVAPGAPSVSLAGAPAEVSATAVNLIVSADGTETQVQVSEDPAFAGAPWQATAPTLPFTLSGGEGVKTVYARFRDAAGNVSVVASCSVQLLTLNLAAASRGGAVAGQSVVLTGWGFGASQGSGYISAGGVPVSSLSWSDSQLTFEVPSTLAAGTHDVKVFDGVRFSAPVTLSVVPSLMAVSVTQATGGDQVALTGANLTGSSAGTVLVGGVSFAAAASTVAQVFPLPAAALPGNQSVAVIAGGFQSNALPLSIVPTIVSLSASSAAAGSAVTVNGTNFGSSGTLDVGGMPALTGGWSATAVTFTVAPDMPPGLQSVGLVAGGAASNTADLTIVPAIGAPSLSTVSGGDVVTVPGSNLGASQGASLLYVAGVTAPATSWTHDEVVFEFPAAVTAGPREAWLIVAGAETNHAAFSVVPSITALSVTAASGNTVVTISGTNFGADLGVVEFDGIGASVDTWSATSIDAAVPVSARPGSRGLVVRANEVTSASVTFEIVPRIDYVSPGVGATGGDALFISGVNLGTGTALGTLTVAGVAATVSTWSPTSIVAAMPAEAAPGAQPLAATWDGTTASFGYTVRPSITAAMPDLVAAAENFVVTGSNLGTTQGASAVVVGGRLATVSAWSMTSVTVVAPELPDGYYNMAVTAGGETSATLLVGVAAPITAPTKLAVTSWSASSVALSWVDNAHNETGYYVKRQTGGAGGYFIVASLGANASSWTDAAVLANRMYEYQVEAHNTYRFSPLSNTATADTYQATQIAMGNYHGCAVTANFKVRCWGANWSGQLGDQTQIHRLRPVDVLGLAGPVSTVTAGDSHSCALLQSGGVQCWGANWYGQLGDGTYLDSVTPVTVPNITAAGDISAGWDHTCVIDGTQTKCWGVNWDGQIGSGSANNYEPMPVVVSNLSGAKDIDLGGNHGCAVTATTGVVCWGAGADGQNGNSYSNSTSTPVLVNTLGTGVSKVGAGPYNGCAILTNGSLKCWGGGWSGQIGDGGYSDRLAPTQVSGLTAGVSHVKPGAESMCAVVSGSVRCWGMNTYGEIGDGTTTDRPMPAVVMGMTSGYSQVASANYGHCALSMGGGVKCWGWNQNGEVGDGRSTRQFTPVGVQGLSTGALAFALGREHTCALATGGSVRCWGANWYGQLGNGTTTRQVSPVFVSGLTSGVGAISGTYDHYCALLTPLGGVRCWGYNTSGQVGNGTTLNQSTPAGVSGLSSGAVSVHTGINFSCAVTSGAGAKCWGAGSDGQLGNGGTALSSIPVDVAGLTSGVSSLSLGNTFACALVGSAAYCWGDNFYGQLGVGTTIDSPYATPVSGLTANVTLVATGAYHACALRSNGSLWCWGSNSGGQLGDGTTLKRTQAYEVVDAPAGITALEMGSDSTCALTLIGEVWCWGRNDFGQLRTGDDLDVVSPMRIDALGGQTALAIGRDHACALANGAAQCWGDNFYSQLGDGYDGWIPRTNLGFIP